MRAVEVYLPGFGQRLQIEQAKLFAGLAGVTRLKDLFLFEGGGDISYSLEDYARKVNSSGVISPFSLGYHSKNSRGWIAGDWGNFYLYSPRGFILARKIVGSSDQEDSFAMAGVSFSVIGNDLVDRSWYPGLDLGFLREGDVLVGQIQSQKTASKASRLELKNIKWERTLLDITVDWARKVGLPRVLVVPSANNYWLTDSHCQPMKEELGKRLFLRYDVTARRCGFKKAGDNLPYLLELPGSVIYKTFWD